MVAAPKQGANSCEASSPSLPPHSTDHLLWLTRPSGAPAGIRFSPSFVFVNSSGRDCPLYSQSTCENFHPRRCRINLSAFRAPTRPIAPPIQTQASGRGRAYISRRRPPQRRLVQQLDACLRCVPCPVPLLLHITRSLLLPLLPSLRLKNRPRQHVVQYGRSKHPYSSVLGRERL